MAKGLNYVPRPFVSRILVETATNTTSNAQQWIDLYTEQTDTDFGNDKANKLKITFNFAFKSLYPSYGNCVALEETSTVISKLGITGYRVRDPKLLKEFLDFKVEVGFGKREWAEANFGIGASHPMPYILKEDLPDYIVRQNGTNILTLPHYIFDIYEYNDTAATPNGNPEFLAYVFFITDKSITPNVFTSEIVFRGGALVNTTSYFVIGDHYEKGGKMYSLVEENLDVDTGVSLTAQVKKSYGAPGQLWCGSVHKHGAKLMAGLEKNGAQPVLKMYTARNDKIVDVRAAQAVDKTYAYEGSQYEKSLSFITTPTFANYQQYKVTDYLIPQSNGVFTEVDYSIRTFTSADDYSMALSMPPAAKVCLFFGMDKVRLLKQGTALPGLLDRLTAFNPDFLSYFTAKINITRFEIARLNVETGQAQILLIGNNGDYFDDAATADPDNKPVARRAKGHRLRRVGAAGTNIKFANDDGTISFYEFRDGELNADSYDNGMYKYSVKVSFRDPIWDYLNGHLTTLTKITEDLDDLLFKTSLKFLDTSVNKTVAVFDKYYQKMNPVFVEKALAGTALVGFTFATEGAYEGVPQSIVTAFAPYHVTETTKYNNLTLLLHAISGDMTALVAIDDYYQQTELQAAYGNSYHSDIRDYLINSTKLATTTPILLEKARSILALLSDKIAKVVSIYSREIKNKNSDVGADPYTDFLKGQGDFASPSTVNEIEMKHTFKKDIDLAKVKDRFDWLQNMGPSTQPFYSLKVVRSGDYIDTIATSFSYLLNEDTTYDPLAIGVDYWFLPSYTMRFEWGQGYVMWGDTPRAGTETFKLFNYKDQPQGTFAGDFENKFYQAMRKKVLGGSTDTQKNVSMLEILAFFGIKGPTKFFELTFLGLTPVLSEEQKTTISLIASALDFKKAGESGDQEQETDVDSNPTGKLVTKSGGVTEKDTASGAPHEWGGLSAKMWDINAAKKILALLFSDNSKKNNYRNLNLFQDDTPFIQKTLHKTVAGVSLDNPGFTQGIPVTMNLLLRLANAGNYAATVSPFMEQNIFDANGTLMLENYYLYILFLCLLGRVEYLTGFTQRPGMGTLTPTSFHYRNQVRSPQWAKLTPIAIGSLKDDEFLYCRVSLYDEGPLIDNSYIRLFRAYFTNDQYFYMGAGTTYTMAPEDAAGPLTTSTPNLTTATGLNVLPAGALATPGGATNSVTQGLSIGFGASGAPTPALPGGAPLPSAAGKRAPKGKNKKNKGSAKGKKKKPLRRRKKI